MTKKLHKYIQAAGLKDEDQFYSRYPTEDAFFADYPHMAEGGYVGNGVLPQIMPGMYPGNAPTLMNQDAKVPMDIDVPAYAHGGFYQRPGYYYDGASMKKAKGSGTYDTSGVYFQQGGYSHPLNQPWDNFERGGYPHPLDVPFDEFKKGGIHIKASKVGSLHTHLGVAQGEKIPVSKLAIKSTDSPAIRKKKQFAINAKKWHHKEGGYIGELANPYHPMHQYMAEGGQVDVNGNPVGAWGSVNTNTSEQTQEIQAPVQQANQEVIMMDDYNHQQAKQQAVSPQYATTAQPVDVATDNGQYSSSDDTRNSIHIP